VLGSKVRSAALIATTVSACWLGMQGVHEFGHVVGALTTGGTVSNVALHPLGISRTDIAPNPRPLIVLWAGPVIGVLLPLVLWAVAVGLRLPEAFLLRFFAGFCLVANGLYLGAGSFQGIGDCGDMLRHGSELWQLWLFGSITVPLGFFVWHGQAAKFGARANGATLENRLLFVSITALLILVAVGFVVGD
jgi:hypothetical protein